MRSAQQLLFPDPQPLVERLGRDFFRQLPQCPGVYLMRDAAGTVLYIGKARNLRKRLGSYRVANPNRMPRRHLRLLRAVAQIGLELCPDEGTALKREAELLRTLRPRFNRVGTWQGSARYLAYGRDGERLLLKIVESPEAGWQLYRPLGSRTTLLRAVMVRLLWCAIHPRLGIVRMPVGWIHGKLEIETAIHCGPKIETSAAALQELFSGHPEVFCEWVRAELPRDIHPFEKTTIESDLEFIAELAWP